MICRFLVFITLIFSISACTHTNWDEDYSSSGTLAFNLIKVCVDKTLSAHSEFNTKNFILDLSEISTLNKDGVDSFFKTEKPFLPVTHEDSVLVFENKGLSKSHVLQNIIVKFIDIEFINKKYVSVKLSKTRSANQVIKVILDLERQKDSYKVIRSEIKI